MIDRSSMLIEYWPAACIPPRRNLFRRRCIVATSETPFPQTASAFFFNIETSERDDGLSVFAASRTRLFGIAYRMLRRPAEAEDIVQDVWLRWQATDRSRVDNPSAFLAKTTTRLCLNFVQSAPSRRETCIDPGLPELVETGDHLASNAERNEELALAVVVLLEKLTPAERAAYILREAFDYSYRQIGHILQTGEVNTRQLVSRARRHITTSRRTRVGSTEQRRLLETFIDAAQKGHMAPLETLLAEAVVSSSDQDVVECVA